MYAGSDMDRNRFQKKMKKPYRQMSPTSPWTPNWRAKLPSLKPMVFFYYNPRAAFAGLFSILLQLIMTLFFRFLGFVYLAG